MSKRNALASKDNLGYMPDGDEDGKTENGRTPNKHVELSMENDKQRKGTAEEEAEEEEDPWNVHNLKENYVHWDDLTGNEKIKRAVMYPLKVIFVLGFLYLFICSLDFLSSAFKLLGGKSAGEVFQQNEILTNPVAGLMMGVLVTVLVQSSSTSTSIVISMVGAGILKPKTAVPIVMGANIGTSVTNTIVAMGQITNKDDFRRAFAGATVHDMFNWLTVLVLLPIEVITGYLFQLSDAIVSSMHLNETLDVNQDLLKVITKPFTTLIIQVSSSNIKKIATGDVKAEDATLMKFCCDKTKPDKCCNNKLADLGKSVYGQAKLYTPSEKETICMAVDSCVEKEYVAGQDDLRNCTGSPWVTVASDSHVNTLSCSLLGGNTDQTACCLEKLKSAAFYSDHSRNATTQEQESLCSMVNSTCNYGRDIFDTCTSQWALGREDVIDEQFDCKIWTKAVEKKTCNQECEYLFKNTHELRGGELSDEAIGGIMLVISLVLLCVCLIAIVKLLHSLLRGPMAKIIKKFINADFPGYCGYFTGYLAILLGAGMTILLQSSSIFTSTLTPLVGIGVVTLDRMYPLTLGSNIGTTFTGILSALAQDVEAIPNALQVAFCHLFFNISGILIFYPLPFFRPPIPAAKFLGNTTAKYRWFAIVYLICMFFVFPAAVFALSIPGWYVLAAILIPIGVLAILIGIVKCIQAKKPGCLPAKLRNWKFLPEPLRSLAPYDKGMKKVFFCGRQHDEEESDPKKNDVKRGSGKGDDFDNVVSTKL